MVEKLRKKNKRISCECKEIRKGRNIWKEQSTPRNIRKEENKEGHPLILNLNKEGEHYT